eukprot:CAMPEP_0176494716 /NCGR_PEP_ID=MMETSP0200_2-20121128/10261_1 /TAXON_ID=947934 /ORGANISM="Chaetoceros sp., Strain GSL56" /LENGTH=423 /DNA_ID=CAMNT_0017892525 /DNA_START=52 /DNA_END=1323 /DNA_ORIENTATION=-
MGKYSKKARTNRSNNPPRGGPGILVLCETGRESKCQREAMDILQYYLYHTNNRNSNSNKGSSSDSTTNMDLNKDTCNTKSHLSLDDEIALLRKGISADAILNSPHPGKESCAGNAGGVHYDKKAPFRVYDTGCRGSVFIMCTMANCELVQTTISTAKHLHEEGGNGDDDGKTCNSARDDDLNHKDDGNLEDPINQKRKCIQEDTSCDDDTTHKKQKVVVVGANEEELISKYGGTWDPIETVKTIFRDVREKNKLVPRSRFVTRIIPIQVTCFASLEEIKANVRELIRKYLLPIGVEQMNKDGDHGLTSGDHGSTSTLPTFKIEFKRRNCSHIRREEVVQATADVIQMLTEEYWTNKNKKMVKQDSSSSGSSRSSESLFRVDLTDAQYTIIIEICRTLCGMSIVENAKSYKNFNLLVVQDQVGE